MKIFDDPRTKPTTDKGKISHELMSPADAATTLNLLISDCHQQIVNRLRAQHALITARNILARLTPTKPKLKRNWFGVNAWFCPKCGLPVHAHEDVNYCGTCGKALDWSDIIDEV